MNCEEVKPLLDSFADGELDIVNHVHVESHLDECLDCDHTVRNRTVLKNALRNDELYFRAPVELRSRIRSSLRDTERGSFFEKLFRWRWMPALAAAAVLLVVLFSVVSVFRPGPSPDDLLASEMVSNHVRSLMVGDVHLMDVPSTDQHTVKPWFEGKLDFSPPVVDLGPQGFALIGGRLDYAGGRPVAAIVYQRRLHVINLFIYPTQGEANTAPKTLARQGFNLVRWDRAGMTFWAVSDLNLNELQEFAGLIQ
jgi:anti-sigma factor RsiW